MMVRYEFLHPFALYQDGVQIGVGFRKRNHLIPCTTRKKKSMRKQLLRQFPATIARPQ